MVTLEQKRKLLRVLGKISDSVDHETLSTFLDEFKVLKNELETFKKDLPLKSDYFDLTHQIQFNVAKATELTVYVQSLQKQISVLEKDDPRIEKTLGEVKALESKIKDLSKGIDDLKITIQSIPHGGNANRKISVGGTVMSTRYNDINFTSGVTATDNKTTRQVDLAIAGGSNAVVYLSQQGIILDGDLDEVLVGTDQSTAVNTLLTALTVTYPEGGAEIVIDGVLYAHDVKLPSGFMIRGLGWGTGIVQSPGGTCAIRNVNWISPYLGGVKTDHDLYARDMMINGNSDYASANPLRTGHWTDNDPAAPNWKKATQAGVFLSPIQFYGVDRVFIDNVYLTDPCYEAIHQANISYGTYTNILVNDTKHTWNDAANTGAIQFEGPDDHIFIKSVTSINTTDDTIAFNLEDWNLRTDKGADELCGPTTMGGSLSAVWHGSITNVYVDGVHCVNTGNGVRILSVLDLADDFIIKNITGTIGTYALQTQPDSLPGYSSNPGNYGDISIEGINCTNNHHTIPTISIAGVIQKLTVRNIRKSTLLNAWDMCFIWGDANVNHLVFDGIYIDEPGVTGVSGGGPDFIRMSVGTVKQLSINNVEWTRGTQATLGSLFTLFGGTVTNLIMNNISLDRVSTAIWLDAGTISNISINNLIHTNGGTGSIKLSTGFTLPRLRASGCNTAQLTNLVGTASITDLRTDGVEDVT